jgi:putative phosphoribosyl transferase
MRMLLGCLTPFGLCAIFEKKEVCMLFQTREEAGTKLAGMLEAYRNAPDTAVIALPRGGVPVGSQIAHKLGVELDIFFVKKIPSSYNEEVGIGAVSENGLVWLNDEAVATLGVSEAYITERIEQLRASMAARRQRYARPPLEVRGKTVIVTDDGIATGSSMLLAVPALRQAGAAHVIVAVPVAPTQIIPQLETIADQVVVYHADPNLMAVGRFYADFHQLSDEEVQAILDRRGSDT